MAKVAVFKTVWPKEEESFFDGRRKGRRVRHERRACESINVLTGG